MHFDIKNEDVFKTFAKDVLPNMVLVTLSKDYYAGFVSESQNARLDFDDTYQFLAAKEFDYTLVTMDRDFRRIQDKIQIIFL